MEIFEPVRELTFKINSMKPSLDIDKIIIHIERAFQLFTEGIKTGNEQNYTDVIYRCNQAFEGCSRQAFLVLAEKTEAELRNIKAWKIEKYLISNNILNERVQPLFKNYREKWRNESSHNFKLFFKEEEAYIAILNICSYAYVLLNQIVQKVSLSDITNIKPIKETQKSKHSLVNDITEATKLFLKEIDLEKYKTGTTVPRISESQFNGLYSSFLMNKFPELKITLEGKLNTKTNLLYDIMIERNDEKIIMEIKSSRFLFNSYQASKDQIVEYLSLTSNAKGIVFLFDGYKKMNNLKINDYNVEKDNIKYDIRILKGIE